MDITVFGIVAGSHLIEDIQRDVPQGQMVTIPEDLALRSKDLWRAINQKQLFLMKSTPNHVPMQTQDSELQAKVERLEAENATLRAKLVSQEAEFRKTLQERQSESAKLLSAQQDRLDAIIKLLSQGVPVMSVAGKPIVSDDVVSGDAPTFIPTTIVPEKADAHIEMKTTEAENPSVSSAANKLREMRQKNKS